MHPLLNATGHRPWPPPSLPWVMRMSWRNLLFAHWPVPPQVLRPLVPAFLSLDTFDGQAWLAVTPFYLHDLGPRTLPAPPVISHFPELNVRTYVTLNGKPGVFFFSLDVANLSAVWGARIFYRLPYWHAQMKLKQNGEWTWYSSRRVHGPQPANFAGRYRPVSPPATSVPGSLEYFLTERYCLYAVDRERLYCAEIHHLPWPLQRAEAEIEVNTMPTPLGIEVPAAAPVLHFAREMQVLVWAPEKLTH